MTPNMAGRDAVLRELAAVVSDQRVLHAVAAVPRECFVPPDLRERAWADSALPIGGGQTISQPLVVARMCELLELTGEERVLDVGPGSGYHAALLRHLAARVASIERDPELSAQARRNLADAGITDVELVVGDGSQGHPEGAPYDAINVAASGRGGVPEALEAQLAPGGRLVMPVDDGEQKLVLVRRRDGHLERTAAEPVRFVPLEEGTVGAGEQPP